MFYKDIIRLYNTGVKRGMKDGDTVEYNHYLVGRTTTTFGYIKELYAIVNKKKP